jgi:TonB family protein
MFPQPKSSSELRPELRSDDLPADLSQTLERHILAGFPPELALDLVLNELVVRAAEATHASAAALALMRGDEMVCRAATGELAPDLGIPINTRDGLSAACVQTRQPQLSVDTEFDPRINPAVSHRLGIRSILIIPVFDSADENAPLTGVLEVFSALPAVFSNQDQKLLEDCAAECARLRRAALELSQRAPAPEAAASELAQAEIVPNEIAPAKTAVDKPVAGGLVQNLVLNKDMPLSMTSAAPPIRRNSYEAWTLALGSLAILAIVAVSFLFGTRIGWLRSASPPGQISQPVAANPVPPEPMKSIATKPASTPKSATAPADELVVYEKGKVVFRLKPAVPDQQALNHKSFAGKPESNSVVKASSTEKIDTSKSIWLSPAEAETLLRNRIEPQYPPEALAAHRSGSVLLEVEVAADGSVSGIRTLNGDPVLAAAASEAVRNWRYQPYLRHDHPAQFQTDVTLTFSLPD